MPHPPSILATIVLELLLTASGGLLARKLCLRLLVEYWRPAALSRPITLGFIGDATSALSANSFCKLPSPRSVSCFAAFAANRFMTMPTARGKVGCRR
jgi:hypothetical protein